MRLLRTISTRRLLATAAGLVAAIVAGSAIAIAATSRGPVPPRKPLPQAIRAALAAPAVKGFSARVTFTNNLISSSDIQGADPLLSGGSGRLWVSPGHGLRLEIQSTNGDAQVVVSQRRFWAYDPASSTVYEGTLPAQSARGATKHADSGLPTVAQIQSVLTQLAGHASVSSAVPGDVAGRPTYTVRISPKASGGLLGGIAVAWDASRGVPLRLQIFARNDSTPVLEFTATQVSYGSVGASVFKLTPPRGAHVVNLGLPPASASSKTRSDSKSKKAEIAGVTAVASHLSFRLDAPASAARRTRSSVTLLGRGKHAGAVVVYGHGLGAVYVIERPGAGTKLPSVPQGDGHGPGLSLPTVTLRGSTTAQELPTALGTLLQFSRGGVSYTVAGSVPAATAISAARSL